MPRRPPRRARNTTGAPATRDRLPGRPPIVSDPTRVKAMLRAISAGVPIDAACQHAGIPSSAHYRAMDAGAEAQAKADNGKPLTQRQIEYREYRENVLRARAQVAVEHVALVGKAAHGGALIKETTYRDEETGQLKTEREFARPEWKASVFLLQSSFREDFATRPTRSQVELSGPGGGPIELAPAEEVVLTLAERLSQVADQQRRQLPGGWDPPEDIDDAELVGDSYGETA